MKRQSQKTQSGHTVHPVLEQVMSSYKKGFRAVVIFSFFINLLMLAVPIYLLQIYDKIIPNHSNDTLYFITAIVVIALVTLATLEFLRNTILAKLGAWFNAKLGDHLLASSIQAASKSTRGSSVNALVDLSKLRDFTTSSAVTSLLDMPWVPLYILILYLIHPLIGTMVLLGTLVLFSIAVFNELTSRKIIKNSEAASQHSINKASSYVRNANVIEAMGMRNQILARWNSTQQLSLDSKYRIDQNRAKTISLVKFLRLLLQIIVIGSAALLILDGQLTPGATIATILLMRNAVSPLERSISAWKSVLKARNAYHKINKHLSHSPSLTRFQEMPEPEGELHVENLRFRYPGNSKSLFSGLGFKLKPGEAMALIGPTASGKTTLSGILSGITKPSSGKVRIGGHDIALWDSQVLGPYIGYLPQSVELFAGTVRENIARMEKGNLEQVIEAAKLVGIDQLINSFPKGYDTQIGDNGAYLSGGQRQRIALARAIYGKPKLVILDEPDAHLDIEGKVALARVIQRLKKQGSIVIVITHHQNIHKFVDRIYDMKKKRFVSKPGELVSSQSSSRSRKNNVVNIASGGRK